MQNRRTTIFFALAILFGIAAAMLAQRMLNQNTAPAPQAAIETTTVMIARLDVNKGSALAPTHLDSVEWPANLVPKGTFSGKDAIAGRVLRHSLSAGEPITEIALLPKGSDAGLVSVITHNLRAVSVKVDAIIGVAGFVTPGSRVDVLATLQQDGSSKHSISKVILQNIPVLAIDQKMEEVKNGEPELVSVVTLEVTPEQAEQLTYSAHEGRLQLALRSPADSDIATTAGVGVSDLMPQRKPEPRRVAYTSNVEVVKGTAVSVKDY
jgi:pilus assembly protein CpaB